MVGAVHGLQQVFLALLGCLYGLETVLAIVVPVAGGDVQALAADVGAHNLLVAVAALYLLQEVLQAQAQGGTLGQPDGQTLAHEVGEHEQFHLLAYAAVVTLLGLFQQLQVLGEHLLLGE